MECRKAVSKAEQEHRKTRGEGIPHWTHWVFRAQTSDIEGNAMKTQP